MKYKKYGNIYVLSSFDKAFEKAESCCADIELLFGVCVEHEYDLIMFIAIRLFM